MTASIIDRVHQGTQITEEEWNKLEAAAIEAQAVIEQHDPDGSGELRRQFPCTLTPYLELRLGLQLERLS